MFVTYTHTVSRVYQQLFISFAVKYEAAMLLFCNIDKRKSVGMLHICRMRTESFQNPTKKLL
jgi:uncharacterized protein (UPF0332 family)